jgi:hypothetical protein
LAAAFVVALSAATALGGSLPTIYANVHVSQSGKVSSVFSVRPRHIELPTYLGGGLTLKWTKWTATRAAGHGTSLPGIAVGPGQKQPTYPVSVKASRVEQGHFTRLQVTSHFSGGQVGVEHLRLTESQGQFNWVK